VTAAGGGRRVTDPAGTGRGALYLFATNTHVTLSETHVTLSETHVILSEAKDLVATRMTPRSRRLCDPHSS